MFMSTSTTGRSGSSRRYSPQFRAEAVQMVITTGKSISEVARGLGVSPQAKLLESDRESCSGDRWRVRHPLDDDRAYPSPQGRPNPAALCLCLAGLLCHCRSCGPDRTPSGLGCHPLNGGWMPGDPDCHLGGLPDVHRRSPGSH